MGSADLNGGDERETWRTRVGWVCAQERGAWLCRCMRAAACAVRALSMGYLLRSISLLPMLVARLAFWAPSQPHYRRYPAVCAMQRHRVRQRVWLNAMLLLICCNAISAIAYDDSRLPQCHALAARSVACCGLGRRAILPAPNRSRDVRAITAARIAPYPSVHHGTLQRPHALAGGGRCRHSQPTGDRLAEQTPLALLGSSCDRRRWSTPLRAIHVVLGAPDEEERISEEAAVSIALPAVGMGGRLEERRWWD
jgi:hypothetical protein